LILSKIPLILFEKLFQYLHKTAEHLLSIISYSAIGKADAGTEDGNPSTPFQLGK